MDKTWEELVDSKDDGFYWCACKNCNSRKMIYLKDYSCSEKDDKCNDCGTEHAFEVLRRATKREVREWNFK